MGNLQVIGICRSYAIAIRSQIFYNYHAMIITYYGGGCFRIQSGERSVLVDPTGSRLKADLILRTLTSANVVPTRGVEISFPGEYEVKDIAIQGFSVREESTEKFLKTAYMLSWEDIRFVLLGHLSKYPSADLIEHLEEPDVLIVPTAGGHFLDAASAAKLIKQLEPVIAIPSFYKTAGDLPKALGEKVEPQEKLVFKQKELASWKQRCVVLEATH